MVVMLLAHAPATELMVTEPPESRVEIQPNFTPGFIPIRRALEPESVAMILKAIERMPESIQSIVSPLPAEDLGVTVLGALNFDVPIGSRREPLTHKILHNIPSLGNDIVGTIVHLDRFGPESRPKLGLYLDAPGIIDEGRMAVHYAEKNGIRVRPNKKSKSGKPDTHLVFAQPKRGCRKHITRESIYKLGRVEEMLRGRAVVLKGLQEINIT